MKEVAPVESNTIPMTANIPSGFGMPICGHLPMSTDNRNLGLGTTSVVRVRQAAAVKGDMGFAFTPGSRAWSPPSS
jgi:hypothetical protein